MVLRRQSCRSCGSRALTEVLSLGEQCIASNFSISADFPPIERRIPLELVRCDPSLDEQACGLVQLRHTVPGDLMYASYGYRSGINEGMVRHLRDLAHTMEKRVGLAPDDLVVDIGANDGTLLRHYESKGIQRIGFEPSDIDPPEPIADVSFIKDYFSAAALRAQIEKQKARIVTSIAMFYDLEEPNRFVADVAAILADDGLWAIELSYLPSMLDLASFDTICHEHLEYYALGSLEHLLHKHGLVVADAELNDTNGGSIRVYVCHAGARHSVRTHEARVRLYALKKRECEIKLDRDEPYARFANRIEKVRNDLNVLLSDLKRAGKRVYGYGASTKGNVILQYAGITTKQVDAIADRNPAKWGSTTPGSGIPIISEEEMRKASPDYLLALPWHFMKGFQEREADFVARGGKFIVPLPSPRIAP